MHPDDPFGQLAGEAEGGVAGPAGFRQRLRIESGTSFFQVGQRVGHGDFGGGGGLTRRVKLGGTRLQLAGHDLVLEELGMRVGVRLKGGARFG